MNNFMSFKQFIHVSNLTFILSSAVYAGGPTMCYRGVFYFCEDHR